jgi:hypothetical protein
MMMARWLASVLAAAPPQLGGKMSNPIRDALNKRAKTREDLERVIAYARAERQKHEDAERIEKLVKSRPSIKKLWERAVISDPPKGPIPRDNKRRCAICGGQYRLGYGLTGQLCAGCDTARFENTDDTHSLAGRDAARRNAQPPARRQLTMADDEDRGLLHFVVGLGILGGLAAYLLLYEPNGLLGVELLVFATLFQMFWPTLLARIAPGLKVDILFFFLTITVGVVAIWMLFQNLPVVIWVTAAWLLLFVIEFPREANVAHSFVAKLRKLIDSTGVDSSSNAANKAGRVGKDGVRRPPTRSKPTPAPAMPYKPPPLPKFDAHNEFPDTPRK